VAATEGTITEQGIRNNIEVGIRYIESWLRGNGAVAIHNLMEDAATAEISRSQLWQWIYARAITDHGEIITHEWIEELLDEEFARLERFDGDRFEDARRHLRRSHPGPGLPHIPDPPRLRPLPHREPAKRPRRKSFPWHSTNVGQTTAIRRNRKLESRVDRPRFERCAH
jgi:hypothetical protein